MLFDKFFKDLLNCADDYKVIIIPNAFFYNVNGNCYTGKSRNIVNASTINGNSNSNAGNLSINSFLDKQQKETGRILKPMKTKDEMINDISDRLNTIANVLEGLSAALDLLCSAKHIDKTVADTFSFLEHITGQTSEQVDELAVELAGITR